VLHGRTRWGEGVLGEFPLVDFGAIDNRLTRGGVTNSVKNPAAGFFTVLDPTARTFEGSAVTGARSQPNFAAPIPYCCKLRAGSLNTRAEIALRGRRSTHR
jgi:hypothetical protein